MARGLPVTRRAARSGLQAAWIVLPRTPAPDRPRPCCSASREVAVFVEHVSDAAAHAGREVPAAFAEHDHQAVGHVLAAVIADAFHDRGGAGVANREALARHAVEECFAAGGAIQRHVADHDVFFRQERRVARRIHDQPAAGKSLADVIVGVAFELERDALREECAEALSGRAVEVEVDRVVRQTRGTVRRAISPLRASRRRCDARCGSAA